MAAELTNHNLDEAEEKIEISTKCHFLRWCSITAFHNIVRDVVKCRKMHENTGEGFYPQTLALDNPVTYRGKVKLHGQNGAITIEAGQLRYQTRNQFADKDTAIGRIYTGTEDYWMSLFDASAGYQKFTVFGEVCGRKIAAGVALTRLPKDIFAVFAIRIDHRIIVSPEEIERILTKGGSVELPERTYILPWHTEDFEIDFRSREKMKAETDKIDRIVQEIDKEDPWVKEVFGIVGAGEGLVMYPVSLCEADGTLKSKVYSEFVFKAKGEAHRNVKAKKSVQVDPSVASSINEYVDLVVTEARLEQGTREIGKPLERKHTGEFVKWLAADVEKETRDELEASGLKWKQVKGKVSQKAQKWYPFDKERQRE